MKKCISLILVLILLLSMLAGCGQGQTEVTGSTEDPFKAPDKETAVSGFAVKEKKYTYQGNDVMILSVENQTDKDYSITLTGEFYDAAGQKLKTESKQFEGFAAAYQNYFVFQPEISFDSFKWSEANGSLLS